MDKTLAATLLLAMLTVAKDVAESEAPPCPCPKCTRRREEADAKEEPSPQPVAPEPAAASSEPPEFGADVGTNEQTQLLYKPQSDVSRILTQMADVFAPAERASIQMLAYLLDAKGPSVTHRTMSTIVRRTLV